MLLALQGYRGICLTPPLPTSGRLQDWYLPESQLKLHSFVVKGVFIFVIFIVAVFVLFGFGFISFVLFLFFLFVCLFETGFLCIALAILELTL